MAYYQQKLIFTSLILAMAVPISTGKTDDICARIVRPNECWAILKPELPRLAAASGRDVAAGVIDLAAAKSKEIGDKLDQWLLESDNDELKEKYRSCSENYNAAARSLEKARRELDSGDRGRISDRIDEAGEELGKCKEVFGAESFDPARVGDRNDELELHLDIARVAAGRLEDGGDDKQRG